jgi:murein DD-endopeptidase MepM/ murein hydrolase activator NlpD
VQERIGAISERHSSAREFARRGKAVFSVGVAAAAIVAITAAMALPSQRPAQAHETNAASPVHGAMQRASRPLEVDDQAEAQRFTGRVGENLTDSLRAAGVPERQGREYVFILGKAIKLADGLSVDDRFDLVVQKDAAGKLGQVLYIGLDRVARADVELLKWTDGKQVVWVNADGVGGEDQSRMGLPVHGRLTSGFGSRFHPILGYKRFHKGVDLAASSGTPIVAAADGRVVGAGWHGGYGQQVEVLHSGGLETTYGHMSRIVARAGEMVRKGQVIGYVGSTGFSTGPHLHFEVTRNGRPVNPMSVKMNAGPAQLQGEKLHAFHNELRKLLLAGS